VAADSGSPAERRALLSAGAALAGVYLLLRYAVPWVSVWLGLSQRPAAVPGFAMAIYMTCAALGVLVYASSDERLWHLFLAPLVRLFLLDVGPKRTGRLLVLSLIPLLAGWIAWKRVMPRSATPVVVRVQHPGQPDAYADLGNPVGELEGDARLAAEREGIVLYQKNCRPCHGTKADGEGPLARGLRLRPVDFTDPGTIATLVESYPLWRIRTGFGGLPQIATPWHSAMPAWEDELEDDEIWRIILAEYRIAGREPRKPEGAER
jgi:mono/diheme cytochrome c family protein